MVQLFLLQEKNYKETTTTSTQINLSASSDFDEEKNLRIIILCHDPVKIRINLDDDFGDGEDEEDILVDEKIYSCPIREIKCWHIHPWIYQEGKRQTTAVEEKGVMIEHVVVPKEKRKGT